MRLLALFAFLLTLAAQPAAAQYSSSLASLKGTLSALVGPNPGKVGIAALDLKTGEMVSIDGDEAFPMASTVKIAVAAHYLSEVEKGRKSLDDRISGVSARALIDAMMIRSSNSATDILIRDLGGPGAVHRWLTGHGLSGVRVDRTIAQLLAARRDLRDVRDSATPKAMVELLRRLDNGSLLRPAQRDYLLAVMARCATGKNRIRGMLPLGTQVQNKTGTLNNYSSDVGFITLPDGRRLAVALFARNVTNRPSIIARASRAIYDSFSLAFGGPRMPSLISR